MRLADRMRYLGHAGRAIGREPVEGLERVREKIAERADQRRSPGSYHPTPWGEARVHEAIGAPWPCPVRAEFDDVAGEVAAGLAERGLGVGRGAYGGWDDGDPALARVAWCLARHTRPPLAIETGVGRGVTTATLLRALELNGDGHLCSIDRPPLDPGLGVQAGAAVREVDRKRWTLLRGSSRRLLPAAVRGAREVALFVHDSMHTARNVLFELGLVWPALRGGAAVLVDDIDRNTAFETFTRSHPEANAFVLEADDGGALIGCLVKPP